MKKRIVVKILLLMSLLILATFGCGKRESPRDPDPILDPLRLIIQQSGDRVDMRQRAKLAISNWQDGVMDPEPFLIDAAIKTSRVEDGERMFLTLVIYDEDFDYVGCVIEEEHVDSNDVRTTLVEKYPIFTHLDCNVVRFCLVPVLELDENQRKHEEQWQKYVNTPRQQLRKEYMRRLKKKYWWRDTLPPVWLSIPEPNKVYVRLGAYDRAGHQSEQINLVYEPRKVLRSLRK